MCTAYVTCLCRRGSRVVNETDLDGCVHCRCVETEEDVQGEPPFCDHALCIRVLP